MAKRLIFYRLVTILSRPLIWIAFRPDVRGNAHLPAKGGFVLSANHLSGFDVWVMSYALAPRQARNMAKNQLFERPLLGPLVRSLGAFPAGVGQEGVGGAGAAAALARAGDAVVIYPEGARRRPDRKHRPRTGAARAALEAGVPLIPAAIRGTDGWRVCGGGASPSVHRSRSTTSAPATVSSLHARARPDSGGRSATWSPCSTAAPSSATLGGWSSRFAPSFSTQPATSGPRRSREAAACG